MTSAFDTSPTSLDSETLFEAKPSTPGNKFSPEVADRLLDKLSSDDEFRALFLADPRAALRIVGHETPAALVGIPGSDPIMCCLGMKSLSSKEALRASRQQLHARLSMSIFHYDIDV
jgi:putative modified peptide